MELVKKTEDEWKRELTPEQYRVLREKGTQRPGTGEYDQHFEQGIYTCAGCGLELFASEAKYDAGCGWPSFDRALQKENIGQRTDDSHGMHRVEVYCPRCGGHLGHVFQDGPTETGARYCINSLSLGFKKQGPA